MGRLFLFLAILLFWPAEVERQPQDRHCGNGELEVEFGEQCDDGNWFNGDGCSAFCQIERGE